MMGNELSPHATGEQWANVTSRLLQRKISRRGGLIIATEVGGLTALVGCGIPLHLPEGGPVAHSSSERFEPQVVDSMETFGLDKPLNDPELLLLYQQLNEQELEIRPDTYYASMFMSQYAYEEFSNTYSESSQSVYRRHEQALNTILANASTSTRVELRRLIIVEDDAKLLPDFFGGSPVLKDSDGGWNFRNVYEPDKTAFYNPNLRIDFGLLHEWGHTILYLNDHYRVDFLAQEELPASLSDLPEDWKTYGSWQRRDVGHDDLMTAGNYIGLYTRYQLEKRVKRGLVHDRSIRKEMSGGFPYVLSDEYQFPFGDRFAGADVIVFGSEGGFNEKRLLFHRYHQVPNNGILSIPKAELPFKQSSEGLIRAENGLFFMDVKTRGGERFFRWLDVRDFSIPYWMGFTENVIMRMNLASARDRRESFDGRIQYAMQLREEEIVFS